jgi:DNA-binding HxlR family transcriptional regulator
MTLAQTYSWIFYAVASACKTEPVRFREIERIADGINHAIPTHIEISESISWLVSRGLVEKTNKAYSLTDKGRDVFDELVKESGTISKAWRNIEAYVVENGVDNVRDVDPNTLSL